MVSVTQRMEHVTVVLMDPVDQLVTKVILKDTDIFFLYDFDYLKQNVMYDTIFK